MARAGRELAIVQSPQLARQCLLGDRDAELLPDPGDEVDQPPAHHAVDRRDRARVDPGHQSRALPIGELCGLPGGLRLTRPSGSWAVDFTIQTRPICTATTPIPRASARRATA